MTRYNPHPQCAARRGDTRCQRSIDHEGPHRAEHHDDTGGHWMRWWFTPSHGWMNPIVSETVIA